MSSLAKRHKEWCLEEQWCQACEVDVKSLKVKGGDIALNGTPISELWSITCGMGSHSVACHLTQVNTPHLNLSQICWYSIYLPQKDGRLS